MKEKQDIRFWVRLPETEIVNKMIEDMKEWKTQSDFFLHLITNYYLTNREAGKKK